MIEKDQRIEPSKRKRTVWRDPAHLAALAALVAAIVPLTAAVNGYFNVQLEHEKYLSELRLKYIERVLDANRDPAARESFLRFMVGTMEPSDKLYVWAHKELANSAEIKKLRIELDNTNAKFQEATFLLKREQDISDGKELRRLQDTLINVSKEKERLEAALKTAELEGGLEYGPSIRAWSSPGQRSVQHCKQNGSEFLQRTGLKPMSFLDNQGDIHIIGMGKASSVYVICSERSTVVNLAVASYRKGDSGNAIMSSLISMFFPGDNHLSLKQIGP